MRALRVERQVPRYIRLDHGFESTYSPAVLASLLVACALPNPAHAASGAPAPRTSDVSESPGWTFDFIAYYWSASIGGSLSIDGDDVDVEDGGDGFFGDPALGGFLGHFEANHGPWSFVVAPIFISADMVGEGPASSDADISIHAQVHEAFVAHTITGGWEWLAGLRYQKLETDLDLSIGGTPLSTGESSKAWTDPIVGVRWHTRLGEDWSLNARADIGGFGVGSDFVWNASLIAWYRFSESWGMQLGYRALSFEFEDEGGGDSVTYDLSMYGPIIALSFSF